MNYESDFARRELMEVSQTFLNEWPRGFDWRWSAGMPPVDCDNRLAAAELSNALRDTSCDPSLGSVASLLDEFLDARYHSFDPVGKRSWEASIELLRDIVARLEAGEPIDPSRLAQPPQ